MKIEGAIHRSRRPQGGPVGVVTHIFLYLASQAPPDGMQHIIWAFSRTPPESADEDSRISIHHRYGSSVLNLTSTTTPVSGGEDVPLPSPVPSTGAGDEYKVDSDVGNTT